jgi:hypothetical protein
MNGDAFDKALERIPKFIWRCPILWEWVEFKGETMFAGLNYERSIKSGRPMIDLFYCATTALNDRVLKTVQYDKKKFAKSKLNS